MNQQLIREVLEELVKDNGNVVYNHCCDECQGCGVSRVSSDAGIVEHIYTCIVLKAKRALEELR